MIAPPVSAGRPINCSDWAAKAVQQNTGIRVRLMPGARILKIVVTKLIAPMIEETPDSATAVIQSPSPLKRCPAGFCRLTGG